MNIEHPTDLLSYLRATGRIHPETNILATPLPGGVSNRTVQVTLSTGQSWVLKQALPKLRVREDWFADPARVGREAAALRLLRDLAPPQSVPDLIFEDAAHHLLAVSAVPLPHQNWKERLLGGLVEHDYVRQFGGWLGEVHRRTFAQRPAVEAGFADRTHFEALRLDPYYNCAAARNPAQAGFFTELITETRATRLCLVHGDYSPKNVLLHAGKLIVLDFEVAHFGDPAFDLGFALTHLLSKAHHLPAQRDNLLEAAAIFWLSYQTAAGACPEPVEGGLPRRSPRAKAGVDPAVEPRAVRHTLACLLARVDGRSPLEYLTAPERERQRAMARQLIGQAPVRLPKLIESFAKLLADAST
jgi:5-methylthioribose kinase